MSHKVATANSASQPKPGRVATRFPEFFLVARASHNPIIPELLDSLPVLVSELRSRPAWAASNRAICFFDFRDLFEVVCWRRPHYCLSGYTVSPAGAAGERCVSGQIGCGCRAAR